MEELARSYCWLPTINVEIEVYAKSCKHCAEKQNNPPKCSISWTEKPIPWYRLHIDHAEPFMGSYFLILVDTYSKWLESKIVLSLSRKTTIKHLREIFSRLELPAVVVSYNGTATNGV
ncbi:Integrase catalytic domain-containing protein [Aphis craccivora]|uniref:Integrase catalytic domain-containing protein n=1 Tax=Aphis craccivora TaxID=307492 RepID=A0A6G0YAG0_APHCR|nr:Integrase catalytic domain-containing protein [Aphis craccivora]